MSDRISELIDNLESSLTAAKEKAAEQRAEHLAWCKQRALEYVDMGDLDGAVMSMVSDLRKHDDLHECPPPLAVMAMLDASRGDAGAVRRFVEGFN